jgi:hypothetical protein
LRATGQGRSIKTARPARRRLRLAVGLALLVGAPLAAYFTLQTYPQWAAGLLLRYVDDRQRETRALKLADAGRWRTLQDGLEARRLTFKRRGSLLSGFRLFALRVDPAKLKLRMVYLPPERLAEVDLEAVAAQTDAIALLNANYFEPDAKVMGLLIADGQTVSPLRREGELHHAVFFIRDGRAALEPRAGDFAPASQAFQAGPWLVMDGKAQGRFRNADVVSRRSAVGVDRQGRVTLAATDAVLGGLSLLELADALAAPEKKGLQLWRAMNCDGGSSTQMLLRRPKESFTIRATSPAPAYLGVFGAP